MSCYQRPPVHNPPTSAAYTFQQAPHGFSAPRFRNPGDSGSHAYGNVMYDRRVYRGNTYANPVMTSAAREELYQREMAQLQRRKAHAQQMASLQRRRQLEAARRKLATPDPGAGRHHIEVQTRPFLEELTDPIQVQTQETQTDPLLDRPPTPLFVPKKTGRDVDTQIYEGDLFNFDVAIEPILEVMVGKTLEQAMLETMQEEELELLRQQQLEFEQRRKEELLEVQKLEAAEKRLYEEKERRKQQEIDRLRREKETREKLQARLFAKAYMANMENRIVARLQDEGWFADRILNEVELNFIPWLMDEVDKELKKKEKARSLVDELIHHVVRLNMEQLERSHQAQQPPQPQESKEPQQSA